MYLLSDYRYILPDELIAQHPAYNREESRLLRLHRINGKTSHHRFKDIENILRPDDLVVINNTRVIPARLKGFKESGGKVEVLILDYIGGIAAQQEKGCFECECMIRASKSPKPGTILRLGDDNNLKARVESVKNAIFNVSFFYTDSQKSFDTILENLGEIPLPPYIRRNEHSGHNNKSVQHKLEESKISISFKQLEDLRKQRTADRKNYQTVYATEKGAVAAPTAGLHFTESLIQRLTTKGIEFVNITLHVGYGTFIPVRVDDIREHQIHSEFFSISQASADAVNKAKSEGRRVIAVGTTSVRTLEYASDAKGRLNSGSGKCDLFIYPGYKFKMIDAVITNFHLPESTLLMLVSAFAGRELILETYKEAVDSKYRFFSYGDAMFIE
ncbi:MAG: tRNA preQ1(34) S-adenosylmethionine ribosyltransferase-isomerase QueA [Desulfamplus sp.]|nr:tRNA preQ1(34) S-adenosylmethionine ribosyltransferase-isomerase QueA [Desulfamplus sp.]